METLLFDFESCVIVCLGWNLLKLCSQSPTTDKDLGHQNEGQSVSCLHSYSLDIPRKCVLTTELHTYMHPSVLHMCLGLQLRLNRAVRARLSIGRG